MKKILLGSLLLSSAIFADTILYKNFEYGSFLNPTYEKAKPEETSLFPVKEKAGLEYYKAPTGEYLLYKSKKLVAVNVSKTTNDSLKEVNEKAKQNVPDSKFLGGNVLKLSKTKGALGRFSYKTEKELLKAEEENRLKATDDSILVYTEAFKNPKKRVVIIYAEEFKKEKSCKKCDFVNEESPKYKSENSLIEIYTK